MTSIYRNIVIFFSLILVFIFTAFFKTYFGLFPGFANTDFIVHVHVALIILWFVLLIVQPILISRKKLRLHRVVGKVSYVVVPMVIISCLMMNRHLQLREKILIVFVANFIDVSIFAFLYLLAIFYRRKVQWHGRFMVLTVLPFLSPSAARLQMNGLSIELAIVLGLLLIERFSSRVYKPYLITLCVFVLIYVPVITFATMLPHKLDSIWNFFFL
jgi:hypothetical protein